MNKIITLSLLSLIYCGYGGGSNSSPAQSPTPNLSTEGFADLRNAAEAQLNTSDAPAVSIAIYKDGEIVFAEAFGNKMAGGGGPVDSNTLFQIGSTTKMFTALATLQLVENDNLKFNSRLLDLLPGIQIDEDKRADWMDITVQHLLTHQGGFEDYVGWGEYDKRR